MSALAAHAKAFRALDHAFCEFAERHDKEGNEEKSGELFEQAAIYGRAAALLEAQMLRECSGLREESEAS